jgi:hypothetical protein
LEISTETIGQHYFERSHPLQHWLVVSYFFYSEVRQFWLREIQADDDTEGVSSGALNASDKVLTGTSLASDTSLPAAVKTGMLVEESGLSDTRGFLLCLRYRLLLGGGCSAK